MSKSPEESKCDYDNCTGKQEGGAFVLNGKIYHDDCYERLMGEPLSFIEFRDKRKWKMNSQIVHRVVLAFVTMNAIAYRGLAGIADIV